MGGKSIVDEKEVDFFGYPAKRQQVVFETHGFIDNNEYEEHVVQFTAYYFYAPIEYNHDLFMLISFTVDGNALDASALVDSVYASAQKID